MKKESYKIIASLMGICLVLTVYIGSTLLRRSKMDFTQEKLYSLTPGTLSILKKLNTNVTLTLYYSKTAAQKGTEGIRMFNNYYLYVKDVLSEYVSNSQNKISLEVVDPRPDTYEEERAKSFGLKKFQLTPTENYFFGLVIKSDSGGEKIIEFFDPNRQENLEYDITKAVYATTHPIKKIVGILSSQKVVAEELNPYMAQMMKMQGRPVEESWLVVKMIRDLFTVKEIKSDVKKIEGVDILLVIHPKNFSEETQFAIDQFLLNGGKVAVLATPFFVPEAQKNQSKMGQMGMMRGGEENLASSDLPRLFKTWGIELQSNTFAGDKNLAGMGKLAPHLPPSKILPLMKCDERCVSNAQDSISSGLHDMVFLYPGALKKLDPKAENITPIVTTTLKGNTYTAQPWELNNPAGLIERFQDGDGKEPVVLGYKIVGKFKSAFPSGIEVSEEVEDKNSKEKDKKKTITKTLTGLKESKVDSAVVVFSDVDFITDQMAFRETILGLSVSNNNSSLLLNTLENLTGNKDLISIRSKGRFTRTFDVIDRIEDEAKAKTATKVAKINESIERFQNQIEQLSRQATDENVAILQNKGLNGQRDLNKKIALLKKELRDVKRSGREQVEKLGAIFQYLNTLVVPFILVIVGVFVSMKRSKRRNSL